MKKGFTLIELLVVIAIIAILAAILFPVFAQAKVAAKKTTAISNQKQINTSIILYMADYDDTYPRNDDCILNSSLNSALNDQPASADPAIGCNGTPTPAGRAFAYRMNHFSWQKWVLPYVKNIQLFQHPGRGRNDASTPSCPNGQWSSCGQLTGSFALNLGLTGALNTWNRSLTASGRIRNSFLGGTQTAIPRPAETMLLMEIGNPAVAFSPTALVSTESSASVQTHYPAAFREIWAREFRTWTTCSGINPAEVSNTTNNQRVFANGITVGFADGSVRFIQVGDFLARTPSVSEYVTPTNNLCGYTGGTVTIPAVPNTAINYPFWGLGN